MEKTQFQALARSISKSWAKDALRFTVGGKQFTGDEFTKDCASFDAVLGAKVKVWLDGGEDVSSYLASKFTESK